MQQWEAFLAACCTGCAVLSLSLCSFTSLLCVCVEPDCGFLVTLLTTPLSLVLSPSKPSSISGPEIIFVTYTSILPYPSSEFFGLSHCPEVQPDLRFRISYGLTLPYLSSPCPTTSRQLAFILHSQLVWTVLSPPFFLMPLHMFMCVGWFLCAGVLDRFIFQISKILSHQMSAQILPLLSGPPWFLPGETWILPFLSLFIIPLTCSEFFCLVLFWIVRFLVQALWLFKNIFTVKYNASRSALNRV